MIFSVEILELNELIITDRPNYEMRHLFETPPMRHACHGGQLSRIELSKVIAQIGTADVDPASSKKKFSHGKVGDVSRKNAIVMSGLRNRTADGYDATYFVTAAQWLGIYKFRNLGRQWMK